MTNEEELNGNELPHVTTFKIQDIIDEAVSQEKERWGSEQEYIIKILSSLLTPDQRIEALSQLYKQGITKTLDLLQNK